VVEAAEQDTDLRRQIWRTVVASGITVIMGRSKSGVRYAEHEVECPDFRVQVLLDLDGGARADISTGVPFLDHLLREFAGGGDFNLGLSVEGSSLPDEVPLLEGVGLGIGHAFRKSFSGEYVKSMGSMGHGASRDALVLCTLDLNMVSYFDADEGLGLEGSANGMNLRYLCRLFDCFCKGSLSTAHLVLLKGTEPREVAIASMIALGRAITAASEGRTN
jgi:imidazoleglycerol-phosphate dehydratase